MAVRSVFCLAAGILLGVTVAEAETILDADATIYSTIDDDLRLVGSTSPPTPEDPLSGPVFNFLDSAHVTGNVQVDHTALVNFSGGTIDGDINIDGGPHATVVNFSGTLMTNRIDASNAIINVSDGPFAYPIYRKTSLRLTSGVLNVSGGVLPSSTRLQNGSIATITGGSTAGRIEISDGTLTVSGGTIFGPFASIMAQSNSTVHVYGGEIKAHLVAEDGGTIHVYGYDLARDGRYLTGRLADGMEIRFRATNDPGSQIILHEIPEPGMCLMLLSGILSLLAVRRRARTALARATF